MVVGAVKRGKALTRAGARPGDRLYVSGQLGKPWDQRIEPRLALGRKLAGKATACIDLSDGLSLDLHRLCKESRVAAQVDNVPIVRERASSARSMAARITSCFSRFLRA